MSTTDLSTALDRAAETPQQRTVLDLLVRSKPEIEKLLPPGVTVDRFERIVRTEIRRTPTLMDCDPSSLLGAVMHCAQLNLEPGPLGLVYLYPYKREVTLIVGYRGYVELAYRSGLVKDVTAELVYDGDSFQVKKGTSPKIEHEQSGPVGERALSAAYAVARLRTGGTVSRVIYAEDWERARKASAAGRKGEGPWATDFPAMVRKTALRRLEPWLPKTAAFGTAVVVDDHPAMPLDEMLGDVPPAPPAPEREPEPDGDAA